MNFVKIFLITLFLLGNSAFSLKSQTTHKEPDSKFPHFSKMQNGDLIRISSTYVSDFAGPVSISVFEIQKNENTFVFLQHKAKIIGKKDGTKSIGYETKLTKTKVQELAKVFEGYQELPNQRRSMSYSVIESEHFRGRKRINHKSFLLPQGWEKEHPKFVSFHLFAESLKTKAK